MLEKIGQINSVVNAFVWGRGCWLFSLASECFLHCEPVSFSLRVGKSGWGIHLVHCFVTGESERRRIISLFHNFNRFVRR